MRRALFAAALIALAGCGPKLDGLQSGESGRVTQIVDGDTIILSDTLRVTLTGVEAPFGDEAYAREARADLERLALGRPARLAYGGLKRIPMRSAPATTAAAPGTAATTAAAPTETALAHVFVQSEGGRWIWLQSALVTAGDVWVRTRRDNVARAQTLLAAESQARRAKRGLWALPDYRLRTPAAIASEAETFPDDCRRKNAPFRVVEGAVTSVTEGPRRVAMSMGPGQQRLDIVIFGDSVETWRANGPTFASYQGKRIRAHGLLENRHGPHLCADHPEQLEVLATR